MNHDTRRAVLRSLLALPLLAGVLAVHSENAMLPAVDVRQGAAMQQQGALMLDVREPDEFAQGHAPGAILIPLGQLQARMGELNAYKDKPVALICRSGNRSGMAQMLMARAGFTKTANVAGGMIAWRQAGLPVREGAAP